MTQVPKKCPNCGGNKLETQGGTEVTRYYENGVCFEVSRAALPKHLVCSSGCGIISDEMPEWDEGQKGFRRNQRKERG